ncbi:MAG: AAA family ATPase, partial [Planctomycetes bacterium]|nr:AAA family ATPase [Planctomycetota bacterium]
MAVKVSLINMKGGVGKSTLAVNLGWYFAFDSKRVLLVDLDPQFNASQYLLGTAEYERALRRGQRTIWDVFEQSTRTPQVPSGRFDIHEAIYPRASISSGGGKIDVILARLELALSLKTPYPQKERELSQAILDLEGEYDLVLI